MLDVRVLAHKNLPYETLMNLCSNIMVVLIFSVPTTRGGRYDITLDAEAAATFLEHELDWRFDCINRTVYRNAPAVSNDADDTPRNRHVLLGRAILGLAHGDPAKVFHAEGNALDYRKTHLTLTNPNRNLSNSGPAIAPSHQQEGSASQQPDVPVVQFDNPPCSKVFNLTELRAMKFNYNPLHYSHVTPNEDDDSDSYDSASVSSAEEVEIHNTSDGPVIISSSPKWHGAPALTHLLQTHTGADLMAGLDALAAQNSQASASLS